MMLEICLLIGCFALSHGTDPDQYEAFIEDVIGTWQLQSPTVIAVDDLPKICMNHHGLLCLSNNQEQDPDELANHLTSIHQHRKQDGLLLVGNHGNENLLKLLSEVAPSLFIANYPLFMPLSNQNDIQLRLDSNIIFYGDNHNGGYKLYDIFAVKGGSAIKLEFGYWKYVEILIF